MSKPATKTRSVVAERTSKTSAKVAKKASAARRLGEASHQFPAGRGLRTVNLGRHRRVTRF